MKKIMFGLAAAIAMVAAADIESSNVVGYTQQNADKGKFIIIGAGFEAVKGGTAINEVLSGVQGVDFDEDGAFMDTAAQVQIPNGVGYDTYYFLNDGWYDDGTEEGATKAGWSDSMGNIVDAELVPGVAFWFKSVPADGKATVAGSVPAETSQTVACPAGFALRANAFPKAIALNTADMTSADIAGVDYDEEGSFMDTANQIQVPNGVGYDTYYFLNDGWYDDGTEEGATKAGWSDSMGNIVDAEIPAGQGFWTKGVAGAFGLTFTK